MIEQRCLFFIVSDERSLTHIATYSYAYRSLIGGVEVFSDRCIYAMHPPIATFASNFLSDLSSERVLLCQGSRVL